MPECNGSSFAQGDVNKGNGERGGSKNRGRDDKNYDKKYWKDNACYKCVKKGHLTSHCTNTKKDKYND